MTLSRAHGFLTAVVSGPEPFEPDEWIRLIFDEPVFADGAEADEILGLILRLHADIERTLPERGRFRPLLEYVRSAGAETQVEAEEWCRGYLAAMGLWGVPSGGMVADLLEPVFLIASPQGATQQALRAGHYRDLCALLPRMAEAVYQHWHG
jgi:uncharacterized protein